LFELFLSNPSAMMRTMTNRVAFAALACISCVLFCVLAAPHEALGQAGSSELLVRIERLENQLRQVTGQLEQMQYRNQQLEAALKRLQDDYEYRFQELGTRGGPRSGAARPAVAQPVQPPAPPPASGGRRSDVFDPAESPNAPGAPRVLGTLGPNQAPPLRNDSGTPVITTEEPPPRAAGAPLDLTAAATAGAEPPTGRPVSPSAGALPPPRAPPGSTGPYAVATAPPSTSPRDVLDLGTGYLQRKDYALAEETFRDFLRRFPSDRLAGEAQYGIGESLFQRQSYQDAANAFVVLSKKYEASAKAPDALLRLGQSLAAINEKELACVAFGDVGRKYPRASPGIKQSVEREQKRVRC
jgi:tol-pal system protein YbgF